MLIPKSIYFKIVDSASLELLMVGMGKGVLYKNNRKYGYFAEIIGLGKTDFNNDTPNANEDRVQSFPLWR